MRQNTKEEEPLASRTRTRISRRTMMAASAIADTDRREFLVDFNAGLRRPVGVRRGAYGYRGGSAPRCFGCADKTPVQILHEYGVRTGSAPEYALIGSDGDAHEPCFSFSVTIGEIRCKGQGSTKKAAKHEAAQAALQVLKLDFQTNEDRDKNGISPETRGASNPVGILQELAMLRGWCLPEYVTCMETGPDHMKEFTVVCRLEGLEETGTGSSKKTARRVAAERMLEKLQSLSGSLEITWSPPPHVNVEDVRHSTGEKISLLKRSPLSIPNTDYIQMLLDLSLELGFQVTYMDIDELTVNGQYQCLVELSTRPVTVCHGSGMTSGNAQNSAAHSALQYIKMIVCKH